MIPSQIRRLAYAIAIAERGPAEIDSGSVTRNNPGDIFRNGSLAVFGTLTEGWQALYDQLQRIYDGRSPYYPNGSAMTIAEMAPIYTGGDNPTGWANNVASVLGVSVDTPLSDI